MQIHSVADIAALIRDRRTALGLDQASLAKQVGVSRDWIIQAEKGKPTARLDLILRTLSTLGIGLHVDSPEPRHAQSGIPTIDLDTLLQRARGDSPRQEGEDNVR